MRMLRMGDVIGTVGLSTWKVLVMSGWFMVVCWVISFWRNRDKEEEI